MMRQKKLQEKGRNVLEDNSTKASGSCLHCETKRLRSFKSPECVQLLASQRNIPDPRRSFCMSYHPLKMKTLFPFETSRYVKLTAMQSNIPEDQNFSSQIILTICKKLHQEICTCIHSFMDHNSRISFWSRKV